MNTSWTEWQNQDNCLSLINRKSPFDKITLLNLDKRMPGKGFVNLEEEKDPDQKGFIIATTIRTGKPTDENWIPIEGGKLKVFKDGDCIL